jgi:uncharacterized protein YoxC
VIDPLFWLGLSLLLVAASLTAVLVAAIPALQELARAARSAEKFFDTLARELPPTLTAIRNTSAEITDLTDDVSEGVKSAGQVVKQFDQTIDSAKKQAQNLQINTRSVVVGFKAAWKNFTRQKPARRTSDRLSTQDKPPLSLREREPLRPENQLPQPESFRSPSYSDVDSWDNDFEDEDLLSQSTNNDD